MNGMTGRRRAIPLSHAMAIHRAACRTIVVEGMRPDSEFAPDSALEQSGFEPLVPLPSRTLRRTVQAGINA